MEMHLATVWESIADAVGSELALVHGRQARTWHEFDDRASRLAGGLLDVGIGPGSKVGIDLYNCSEFFETFFAALKVGAVPVAVNYRYRERELLLLLDDWPAQRLRACSRAPEFPPAPPRSPAQP